MKGVQILSWLFQIMTKKTNSLVLRYGTSVVWKKKTSSVNVISSFLQLDKLINVWLKKKNLNLVETRYGSNLLYIFVYKRFFFDERLKNSIIKFYKKTLNDSLVIQKFGVHKNQLDFILSETNVKNNNTKGTRNINLFYFLWCLRSKKSLCLLLFTITRSIFLARINVGSYSIQKLLSFYMRLDFLTIKKVSTSFAKNILMRKINGYLKIKLISQSLENLIFKLKSQHTSIKIKNIYLMKNFFRVPFLGKQIMKPEFRFKFFTVFLAIAYHNSFLLAEYVADLIKKGKQHRKSLQIFTNFFERIFSPRLLLLSGFQLRVSGKLGGKLRKSKYHYKIGKVQLQTLKNPLSYCMTTSYTKFGVFSIKVWLVK